MHFAFDCLSGVSSINNHLRKNAPAGKQVHFCTTQVCKPGSVIDSHLSKPAIARRFQPPPRDGRANLLSLHGVAPDRVYIVKPISLWAGCALTAPFHPYLAAVYLCCTCPGVTPGGRYPLSLPYGARTFLTRDPLGSRPRLSDPVAKVILPQVFPLVKQNNQSTTICCKAPSPTRVIYRFSINCC